jgi:4-methyl-5(b-hydroxyethyl)-thiazole monophosphate biosynthesis
MTDKQEAMRAKVLVPIADGTEEMEAVIIIDVLRRAQVEVRVASVMAGRKEVTASRGVRIVADALLEECLDQQWDMIVLPGGMPGATHFHDSPALLNLLRDQVAGQRWIAAICAAPAVVLGRHKLIPEAVATCYPNFQPELASQVAQVSEAAVEVDGKLVTSQGPGTAMAFALRLVELLTGPVSAREVAAGMVFTG